MAGEGIEAGSVLFIEDEGRLRLSEEVEGIIVRYRVRNDGVESQIHVVLLDNDVASGDDIFFKHYSVPEPGIL